MGDAHDYREIFVAPTLPIESTIVPGHRSVRLVADPLEASAGDNL
jgi:hypothetical protein